MDESTLAYLESVVGVVGDVLGENLRSVWLVGSLVTGDFDARRSDVDLLVTCGAALGDEAKRVLGQRLTHASLPCPARGVDLLMYLSSEVAEPRRIPHFEFSISSGIHWKDEVDVGGPYPGGLIDLATARQLGVSIFGPSPQEAVGTCPAEWIFEELTNGVRWHTTRVHDPFHDPTGSNAVLNGCRALHFLSEGAFVSKTTGARWLLGRNDASIVAEALAEREAGGGTDRLDGAEVLGFLDGVLRSLAAGAV